MRVRVRQQWRIRRQQQQKQTNKANGVFGEKRIYINI